MSEVFLLTPEQRAADAELASLIDQCLGEVVEAVGTEGVLAFFAGYREGLKHERFRDDSPACQ